MDTLLENWRIERNEKKVRDNSIAQVWEGVARAESVETKMLYLTERRRRIRVHSRHEVHSKCLDI